MYAVGFKDKQWQAGNDGLQRLSKTNKANQIKSATEQMRRICDEVYIVYDFTQAMCEMDNQKLHDTCEMQAILKFRRAI